MNKYGQKTNIVFFNGFLMFLDHFHVLMLKIILKKYHFNIFLKKYFFKKKSITFPNKIKN